MATGQRAVPNLKVWLSDIGVSDTARLVKCLKNEFDPQKKLDVAVHT